MGIIEIIILSIGLAMDAFAVATCKGLAMKDTNYWKNGIIIALYFGAFQAIMPVIGYLLGVSFQEKIIHIDHWIAFILLCSIGINMLKDAFIHDDDDNKNNNNIDFKNMIILAIATSIDALAVGITFAFLKCNLFLSVSFIGCITFILSLIGFKIGNLFGAKYEKKAQIVGGAILIILALKILLEHLQFFSFIKT